MTYNIDPSLYEFKKKRYVDKWDFSNIGNSIKKKPFNTVTPFQNKGHSHVYLHILRYITWFIGYTRMLLLILVEKEDNSE